MTDKERILEDALKMPPSDRAEIIDQLLQSLDKPDKEIDDLWAKEAEDRIDAFEAGKLKAVTVREMLN